MLYNGINVNVNPEQHAVITQFLSECGLPNTFNWLTEQNSEESNIEIWWHTASAKKSFSGTDGPLINGVSQVVQGSYHAKSPDDFINAFNHWKEHGVLDSEVFK
ncbi:TPA: hypothetical protein N2619_004567 [Salmonella enterica]|uniref:Uncharacterized protein n=2 Tax=Friunavirus TaxID=1985711 RepID=A0AAE8XKF4_9CAUD|nr:hypothetical protein APK15_18 [Acinetobacter phage APK15]UAW10053.1 hypothetical protein APK20_20 [Acinetobacter phage APK20]HCH8298219.1 hypothetical protein [Salmonella enterica]HCH9460289.1 hypothetical protein [Salmonella enterica]HCM0366612.1 hypothetical protein [Salmonella enterica]